MVATRKTKSLEELPQPRGQHDNEAASSASPKSTISSHHRSQSSIPKPSGRAPLFRPDVLDRFYSRIPYPTKGSVLPTEEEEERKTKRGSRKSTPRGGLTNVFVNLPERNGGVEDGHMREIDSLSGISPSISVAKSHVNHRCHSQSDDSEPRTPLSRNTSPLSMFKTHSYSVGSQLTVLEHGSESSDLLEEWEQQSYCNRSSTADSVASFDASMDDSKLRAETKTVELRPLPRSFLNDCLAETYSGDFSFTKSASAMDFSPSKLSKCDMDNQTQPSRTPSSFRCRSECLRTGCMRRRPQIPVSESTLNGSIDGKDALSKGPSPQELLIEWSKKRTATNAFSSLFRREKSITASIANDPSDDDLDDMSLCTDQSEFSSAGSLPSRTISVEPYDWVKHHSQDLFRPPVKPPNPKLPAEDEHRPARITQWMRSAFGMSLKALAIASGVVFVRLASGHYDDAPAMVGTTEDEDYSHQRHEFDTDTQTTFSFSSVQLTPHAPITCSYPLTLLDLNSDLEA